MLEPKWKKGASSGLLAANEQKTNNKPLVLIISQNRLLQKHRTLWNSGTNPSGF